MRLNLYCNRYKHFKDALVCSVNCVYRTRCQDFALFYDERRAETDAAVAAYYAARQAAQTSLPTGVAKVAAKASARVAEAVMLRVPLAVVAELNSLVSLEVKRVMSTNTYIWISKDDQAEVLEHEEVIRRAERGAKAKSIFKVAQEMELRFQLVPRRGIERAKRAAAIAANVEAERAAARRSRPRLITPEAVTMNAPKADEPPPVAAAAPRRARNPRLPKAVGEK